MKIKFEHEIIDKRTKRACIVHVNVMENGNKTSSW